MEIYIYIYIYICQWDSTNIIHGNCGHTERPHPHLRVNKYNKWNKQYKWINGIILINNTINIINGIANIINE